MTGTGAGIRSPRGGTGEQEGTCGVPRRGAGRAPASVGRVKCGFWKMRESSNLAQELGERLDQGTTVPPGGTGRAAPSVLRRARSWEATGPVQEGEGSCPACFQEGRCTWCTGRGGREGDQGD